MLNFESIIHDNLKQNHGYFHGGVLGALADNACGMAAGTLVPEDLYPITSEYKINILSPAKGVALLARGEVIKPGRTLIISKADVFAIADDQEKLCATMLATLVCVSS